MPTRVGTPSVVNVFTSGGATDPDPDTGDGTQYDFDATGDDLCLFMSIAAKRNGAQPSVTGIMYDGVAMSLAAQRAATTNGQLVPSIWYITETVAGGFTSGIRDFVINFTPGTGGVGLPVVVNVYSDVNQVDPIGAVNTGTTQASPGNNLSFPITNEEDNSANLMVTGPSFSFDHPAGMAEVGSEGAAFDNSDSYNMVAEDDDDAGSAGSKTYLAVSATSTTLPFAIAEIKDKATEGGAEEITGDVDASLPVPTAAIVGAVDISGDVNANIPNPTAVIAGAVDISGTVSGTAPNPTAALVGAVDVSGDIAASLPVPNTAIVGAVDISGTVNGTAPNPNAAITGSVDIAGDVAASFPVPTAAINGVVNISGNVVVSLPVPTIAIEGSVSNDILGIVNAVMPSPSIAIAGAVDISGTINTNLPNPTAVIAGAVDITGAINAAFPVPEINILGGEIVSLETADFIGFGSIGVPKAGSGLLDVSKEGHGQLGVTIRLRGEIN